ncbi:MAG: hypothetical protein JXQ90_17955 [Cyclobacteriaceae bacterium]
MAYEQDEQLKHDIAVQTDGQGVDMARQRGVIGSGEQATKEANLEIDPNTGKKKDKYDELLDIVLSAAEQAHRDLIDRLNEQLTQIEASIAEIETKMEANRRQWETSALRLDQIDDIFSDAKHGKDINTNKAAEIIRKAGKDVPKNATQADYLLILNTIKVEDLSKIERLDNEHGQFEYEHKIETANKEEVKNLIDEAIEINNNENLTEDQKLEQTSNVASKFDSAVIHKAGSETKNEDVKQKLDETRYEKTALTNNTDTANPLAALNNLGNLGG